MAPQTVRPYLALFCSTGLLVAGPALADDAVITLQVKMTDLSTAAGQTAVRRRMEAVADAYCRGNPGEGTTVHSCRAALTTELERDLEARTDVALQRDSYVRFARK